MWSSTTPERTIIKQTKDENPLPQPQAVSFSYLVLLLLLYQLLRPKIIAPNKFFLRNLSHNCAHCMSSYRNVARPKTNLSMYICNIRKCSLVDPKRSFSHPKFWCIFGTPPRSKKQFFGSVDNADASAQQGADTG